LGEYSPCLVILQWYVVMLIRRREKGDQLQDSATLLQMWCDRLNPQSSIAGWRCSSSGRFCYTRRWLQACLHAVFSACGFFCPIPPTPTSHAMLFLCGWRGRGVACRTCVMHASGRVRGCSTRRFGPFTHGDGLGDGGGFLRHVGGHMGGTSRAFVNVSMYCAMGEWLERG
jgi:hypothetical protein